MKITHVINNLATGGAERLVVDLAEASKARGIDTEIVTLSSEPGVPLDYAQENGIAVTSIDSSSFSIKTVTRLRNATQDASIIHAHLFPVQYLALTLRRPLVFTEHSTFHRRMTIIAARPIERASYAKFDAVVAVSTGVQTALESYFKQIHLKKAIDLVPNGIRDEFFGSGSAERIIGANQFRLIMVGSLTPVKAVDVAIRAIQRLSTDSTLTVVGDGPDRTCLEDLVRELGVESRVRFLGIRRDIPRLLQDHDALLSTSRLEGFGLAAAEALAAGLPVVGPDVPGFRDVVTNGSTGVLFDPGSSVDGVVTAIETIADSRVRARMSARARLDAQRFSISRTHDGYQRIYEDLIKSKNTH